MAAPQITFRGQTTSGTAGVPVDKGVRTNLFRITTPTKGFDQYDAILLPGKRTNKESQNPQALTHAKPVPKRFFKPVIDYLQKKSQYSDRFKPPGAYDGVASFYLSDTKIRDGGEYTFEMPGEGGERRQDPSTQQEENKEDNKYTVKLVWVRRIEPRAVEDTIYGRSDSDGALQAVNAINAVVRMAPLEGNNSHSIVTKRAFFNPNTTLSLGGGLELLIGLYGSVRPTIKSLALNLDTTSIVLYRAGPLIDYCLEVLSTRNIRQLEPRALGRDRGPLFRALKHIKVIHNASYPRDRKDKDFTAGLPKRFSIAGLTQNGADRTMFKYEDRDNDTSQDMSVEQYFRWKYNKPLQCPTIVCAQMKNPRGKEIAVPLEFLDIPMGQKYTSTLNAKAASLMINKTKAHPRRRMEDVQQGFQDLRYENSNYIRASGMTITSQAENPPARLLQHPNVLFGGGRPADIRGGGWDTRGNKYIRPSKLLGWAIVVMDQVYRDKTPRQVIENGLAIPLWETLKNRGLSVLAAPLIITDFNMQGPVDVQMNQIVNTVLESSAAQAFKQGWRPPASNPNMKPLGESEVMLVCILNQPDNDLRGPLKRWSEVERGVATQIVASAKIRDPQRPDSQYLNNLALKINCKLGGSNSAVNTQWFQKAPTLILGADVSHPSPGSDAPSIASLVFNIGPDTCMDYAATARVQHARSEMIEDIVEMFQHAFDSWKMRFMHLTKTQVEPPPDKYMPRRIIFFRDGVSEGEFSIVSTEELGRLRQHFNSIGLRAKISFIVVGKRHHIRFFPAPGADSRQQDPKNGNLPSGLVVDQQVVHPLYRDFYLQSQKPLMGTSRPAHYTVLHDENGMSQDDLQRMCFDLCHMYGRSTTAVSIPAPIYYADLVCVRARLHLGELFGSDASVSGSGLASQLDSNTRAQWNARCAIHYRQRGRMYFV